ncbi:MAG: hypothetical protein WKF30_02415 [Pyrinomonadaceae bacterium]
MQLKPVSAVVEPELEFRPQASPHGLPSPGRAAASMVIGTTGVVADAAPDADVGSRDGNAARLIDEAR